MITLETVQHMLKEMLGIENLPEPSATLSSLDIDSIDLVDIIFNLEDNFKIQLKDEEVQDPNLTVEGLAALVDRARKK